MGNEKPFTTEDNVASLGIYVQSYHRYDAILSQDLFEYCTYVVRASEEELYRKAGVKAVWPAPDEEVDNAIRTYWWIVDHAPEDIVFVADDDIEDVMYRLDDISPIDRDPEIITAEVERIAQLMLDLDIGYAAIDATGVPYGYDGEFAFKGTSGSMKWVNKAVLKARPDERVKYNYDLDLILQELLLNRIILKPRYIVGKDHQDTNAGGDSSKKRRDQLDSIENMKQKWGKYFRYNLKTNKPMINVPR